MWHWAAKLTFGYNMTAIEPELITIIEGPTPEFRPTPVDWVQSVLEGPIDRLVAVCQLRTGNGEDIMDRCRNAWKDGRPVRLDFPDEMRMRQQVDVVSLRLEQLDEGEALMLWVALPLDDIEEMEEMDDSDEDDDLFFP
jgi:hypothetical protein